MQQVLFTAVSAVCIHCLQTIFEHFANILQCFSNICELLEIFLCFVSFRFLFSSLNFLTLSIPSITNIQTSPRSYCIRQITSTVLVLFIHEIIPLENYKFFKGVSMDKITHQVRAEHWAKIMNECINSGMSKTAWCRANGISEKQFFYWQRILRREAFEKSQNLTLPVTVSQDQLPATQRTVAFTEIKLPSSPQNTAPVFRPDLVIRKGNLILEIANSASEDLLSRIRGILNAE